MTQMVVDTSLRSHGRNTARDNSYIERFLKTATEPAVQRAMWWESHKAEARKQWQLSGLPESTQEEWRLTNLNPIIEIDFSCAPMSVGPEDDIERTGLRDIASCEMVFANGRFVKELSQLPTMQLSATSLNEASLSEDSIGHTLLGRQALVSDHGFIALNSTNFSDGALVQVPEGTKVALPLHLIFYAGRHNSPYVIYPRILINVGCNASVTVVVSFLGPEAQSYLTNSVTEIYAGAGSRVEMVKIQCEGSAAYHVGSDYVHLDSHAVFQSLVFNQGGILVRNNTTVVLDGPGAEATLNGLSLTAGCQHVDNHTMLDHASEKCPSHELYKSLLAGHSSGVFKGKILVRPGAQKTDAKQNSKAVLLSDDATINSQPQLEIYADDVKCTHGSTTGPLDEAQLFYLRARGLGPAEARAILTYAFAADVIARVWHPGLKTYLQDQVAISMQHLERG